MLKNILLNKWLSIFDLETTTITYKQILLLPYLYFKNRTTGEIISRFKDLNTVRSFICNLFTTLGTDLISIIIFSIIMVKISKELTIIVLIIIFITTIYTILFNKKKKKLLKEIAKGEDTINSYLIQGVSNVDTIKGSHLEKRIIDKFSINYKVFIEKIYNFKLKIETYSFVGNNSNDLLLVIIYGLGSYLVIKNKLPLSNLIVYQSFYMYFINCFYRLIHILEDYEQYKISLCRIEELFMINSDNFKKTDEYFFGPIVTFKNENGKGNGGIVIPQYKPANAGFFPQNSPFGLDRNRKV